jgi:hypothetical protein
LNASAPPTIITTYTATIVATRNTLCFPFMQDLLCGTFEFFQ